MIALAPVLIGVVGRLRVDLHPEVQKLLLEDRSELHLRRYLEGAILQGDLNGAYQVAFGHAVGPKVGRILADGVSAVDRHADWVYAVLVERIEDTRPDAGTVDEEAGVAHAPPERLAQEQALDVLDDLRVAGVKLEALQMPHEHRRIGCPGTHT